MRTKMVQKLLIWAHFAAALHKKQPMTVIDFSKMQLYVSVLWQVYDISL